MSGKKFVAYDFDKQPIDIGNLPDGKYEITYNQNSLGLPSSCRGQGGRLCSIPAEKVLHALDSIVSEQYPYFEISQTFPGRQSGSWSWKIIARGRLKEEEKEAA